jgi:hypothetical protein
LKFEEEEEEVKPTHTQEEEEEEEEEVKPTHTQEE